MLKYHIQTIELSAASKAITFSSIPQTFDDLLLVYSTRSDRSGNVDDPVNITLNGSGAGYSSRGLVGTGSSAYSEGYGTSVIFAGYMPAPSTTSNTFGSGSAIISNYRSSSPKSMSVDFVSENNATTAYQNMVASIWTNSAAVTSLTVSAQIANLVQFSSASLYGIRRGSDGATITSPVATGGTVTTSGGYTIHTFNSSGTFSVNRNVNVEYLVIGGGGGGAPGGGGAGGYRCSVPGESSGAGASAEPRLSLPAGASYAVTVGAGGAGGAWANSASDGNLSAFSTVTSFAGGGGGGPNVNGRAGGSGGGAGSTSGSFVPTGGAGTSNQGFSGGNGTNASNQGGGGGGGGAGQAGGNWSAGVGGNGLASSITGSSVTRAGGGGSANNGRTGGSGGGGTGGSGTGGSGTSGTANTGSGGGGTIFGTPGAGGSGVVIIRYLTPA